jgi:diguanylate cyclase (GGDEF)-like protein
MHDFRSPPQPPLDIAAGESVYRTRLEQRLRFERLLAEQSAILIHADSDRLDAVIENALGQVGSLFGVDRAYLFRFSDGHQYHTCTHEWVAEGVSREAENLQQVPVTTFPWLMRELLAGRSVHVPRVADLPDEAAAEREEFMREGIRSLVLVPFGPADAPSGFIGFDAVRADHVWSDDVLLGLRLLGQMFDGAFRALNMAEELKRLALHDDLTGLANRKLLRERMQQAIARCRRNGYSLAVILIDVDDFKLVNDSLGHSLGDGLLRILAERLRAAVRDVDTVARIGGDEFVLLAETRGPDELAPMLERLIAALREPVRLDDEDILPAASIGVALHPADGEDPEMLLRHADAAMYAAKAEGKDRFRLFTREGAQGSRDALRLRQQLRAGLAGGEIVPWYQPRVCLRSGRVLGFEALARWQHPQRGLLEPGAFLPLAAQIGIDGDLDLCILDAALADLRTWRREHPLLRVSVNVGARNLTEPGRQERLRERLVASGPLVANLEIEITEGAVIRDLERAREALERLCGNCPGLHLSLDDFGSGYSSLSYLRRLPLTTLKIDQGFVADLEGDRTASTQAIVRSILDLGRNLGLHVVAEGIETDVQARELLELGCAEGQGFHFSRPVPAAEATRLLSAGRLPLTT